MQNVYGFQCLRCGEYYYLENDVSVLVKGCPKCATSDSIANLSVKYDENKKINVSHSTFSDRENSMWRYFEFLPIEPEHVVTIGEGRTPLIPCIKMAKQLGVEQLFLKDETRNPTWSHKDRAMSVGLSHALEFGARVVTTSSSGNEGGSLSAYAARAGLDAVVFTSASCPPTMRTLMQVYGAKLIATPTSQDRFTIMGKCIETFGWYPMSSYADIPIGINPIGIEGYKTIAFEICEDLDFQVPDFVIVPTCWGDVLQGIWKGFKEFYKSGLIDRLPGMIAAEVFGPLTYAIEKKLSYIKKTPTKNTVAISIGAGISTWQALNVLFESKGSPQDVNDDELLLMQSELARSEGIFAEASSIASVAALKKLRENNIVKAEDLVVSVITSSGLKDPGVARSFLPEVPLIEPNLDALELALKEYYDMDVIVLK
jgi:threonine synthase